MLKLFSQAFHFHKKVTAGKVLQMKTNSSKAPSPDILLNKGFDAYKLKKYDEARQVLEEAANSDKIIPNKFRAMDELGDM